MAEKKPEPKKKGSLKNEIKKAIRREGLPPAKGTTRKDYIRSVQDEGYTGELKIGKKYYSGTSKIVQDAYKATAARRWDIMDKKKRSGGK